jgi:hypothetical protein
MRGWFRFSDANELHVFVLVKGSEWGGGEEEWGRGREEE